MKKKTDLAIQMKLPEDKVTDYSQDFKCKRRDVYLFKGDINLREV